MPVHPPALHVTSRPLRHLVVWVTVVALIALTGAVGYMLIEGWSFWDSFYMSVITLTTTGFREVHPMNRWGEGWTMVLSITAIGIIFGTVGVVAEQVVAEVGSGRWEQRRMERKIQSMHDHFIVCGFGRVGAQVAAELRTAGEQVVVIDTKENSINRAVQRDFPVVSGDSSNDDILEAAGVRRARGLVSCIDSDSTNVYVTLTARALNPRLYIVARASSSQVMGKLTQAGADHAVSPYTMAGHRIASLAVRPGVVNFMDAALNRIDLGFGLEEIAIGRHSRLAGCTVAQLRDMGLFVLAIHHADDEYEPNPTDDRRIPLDVSIIVSGTSTVLKEFRTG